MLDLRQFYVDPTVDAELRRLASTIGMTKSEVLRVWLDAIIGTLKENDISSKEELEALLGRLRLTKKEDTL